MFPTAQTESPTGAYSPPDPPSYAVTAEQRKASHAASHSLSARSCVTCRRRKVKCDKKEPCSNCARAGSECVFPAPGRAPRRPKAGGKATTEREEALLKRLKKLEGVVEELSGQVEIEAGRPSPASDSSMHAEGESSTAHPIARPYKLRVVGVDERTGSKKEWITKAYKIGDGPSKSDYGRDPAQGGLGRMVFDGGKSRYLSHPFWSQITDEVEEIREMLDDQDLESDSDAAPVPKDFITDGKHQGFLMGYSSTDVDLRSLHPLPSQIPFYWETFLENVHPLVKILHAPTMTKTIKEVQNNLKNLSKSTEALMFSIYFATVTSMNAEQVQSNFGVAKTTLLNQYRFGTEQALARAGLLNTNEIVTVQAFILFLVCVRRHDDTKFVWTMTGLAIRIAQSLGLHRDGEKFGLPPFDTEMRRRLWWQVCLLDVRASEDHGSDPTIQDHTFDTEFPTSCNDEDLSPNDTVLPTPQPGVSEMTFCLIRYEICSLSRQISYVPPGLKSNSLGHEVLTFEEKQGMVKKCAMHLEETYLKYCEDAGPLYWVAATVARLIMAKIKLLLYHPFTRPGKASTLSQDTRDSLFMSSIEILEFSQVLQAESTTKQWGWLFSTYIQWHAIAYLLGELAIRGNSTIVERAWRALDSVFGNWDMVVKSSKGSGMLWKPIRSLMGKARLRREGYSGSGIGGGELELGMREENIRPAPMQYGNALPTFMGADGNLLLSPPATTNPTTLYHPPNTTSTDPINPTLCPQIVGMGTLAPEHIQNTLQRHQQLNQLNMQTGTTPWLMDDNALVDLDMQGMEGANWEGWDELVRDFQMDGVGGAGIGGAGG
ncbi:hypothetical protein HYFRA_00002237, partial [Hymenoscyphus fraxineus]